MYLLVTAPNIEMYIICPFILIEGICFDIKLNRIYINCNL